MKQFRNEYSSLIVEVDRIIINLKKLLDVSPTAKDSETLKISIDMALEERMRFMKLRDAVDALGAE